MGWTSMETDRAGMVRYIKNDIEWVRPPHANRILKMKWDGWSRLWLLVECTRVYRDETGEWCTNVERIIVLYMVQCYPKRGEWVWKEVPEEMGPYQVSAPYSWLKLLTAPTNDYSREWREKVRKHHALTEASRQSKVGSRVRLSTGDVGTVISKSPLHVSIDGYEYRVKRKQIVEVL